MIKKTLYKLLIFILCSNGYLIAQQSNANIIGIWQGYLHIATDSLSVVIVVEQDADTLRAEMDSPDQYAFGIKADAISLHRDTLTFKINSAGVTYTGIFNHDEQQIEGTFLQYKAKYPLILKRISERTVLHRPQMPIAPFHYNIDEKIVIHNKENKPLITGTLTWPENASPKALVILISGSGWQDRDETIYGHKPFWVIADYLTREGYAVFRYDDVYPAIFRQSTTLDFVNHVNLIVDSLTKDNRCKNIPVVLAGHSEGGLVALMAASQNKKINLVVSMAGVAEPFEETLLFQAAKAAQKQDFTQIEIDNTVRYSSEIYEILKKSKNKESAMKQLNTYLDNITQKMSEEDKTKYGFTSDNIFKMKQQMASPWFYQLFKITPSKYIKKVTIPVYVLNGEKDMQVNATANVPLMQKYLPANKQNRFDIFPGLNHLFQEAETGMYDEYGTIEQTISPIVLKRIKEWLDFVIGQESSR